MTQTKEGARKAKQTVLKNHGKDFYREIGRKGGSVSHRESRPFVKDRSLAVKCGRNGGKVSKRGPIPDHRYLVLYYVVNRGRLYSRTYNVKPSSNFTTVYNRVYKIVSSKYNSEVFITSIKDTSK